MSWFDTATDFLSKNSDWIKPIVKTGLGALNQSNTDNAQSQYLDYLRQKEDQNYQNSVDQINAYNAQIAGGGGGGSGASAAAARANDAKRMAASKKAQKVSQKTYKKLLEMYKPYRETADQLLPQMTQTYEDSLGLQKNMLSFLNTPEQQATLTAAGPAWNVNVPLPDSVRLK